MKARNLKYHARPADCLPESDGWRYRHDYQLLFGNMSHVLLPPPPPTPTGRSRDQTQGSSSNRAYLRCSSKLWSHHLTRVLIFWDIEIFGLKLQGWYKVSLAALCAYRSRFELHMSNFLGDSWNFHHGLSKARLRKPRVRVKSDFRSGNFKRKFGIILFVYNLLIECTKRNKFIPKRPLNKGIKKPR